MRKLIVLFLLILLATTTSFSQTISQGIGKDSTILITQSQLKETNLIFVEHAKLLRENTLLYKQLENYKEDNKLLLEADSLRTEEISNYKQISKLYQTHINELNSKIKKKEYSLKLWRIGGVTVSAGFLILLLLK